MWRAAVLLLLLLAALPIAYLARPVDALSLTDNPVTNTAKKVIDWILGGIKSIFSSIVDAIKGIFAAFADGVKGFAKTIFDTVTKPFRLIADGLQDSYNWLKDKTGPLAPILFTLIAAGVVLVIWYIVKYIVPGPVP